MEHEVRKKRKQENYKVTLLQDKIKNSFPISGLDNAYFPYQPYPQQINLIKKLYEAIQNNHNVLVESPTGTGKTLCMLVASLSSLCNGNIQGSKPGKIYYLTRTHSQITQVISELKRLPWYSCKANIIASRQHLCINRNLKQLKGRQLDRGCQQMCKQKLCRYREEVGQNSTGKKQWLTIQQLCEKGNKQSFCPYYYTKLATEKSQITVLPFNYLLDWNLLESNNFNLKNSIIIFDEAHNIDALAEEGSSLSIDTQMLTQSLTQIKNLQQSSKCRYLHKKFETSIDQSDTSYISQAKSLITKIISYLKEERRQKNFDSITDIVRQVKKMTNFVYQIQNNYDEAFVNQEYEGADLNNYEQFIYCFQRVRKLFSLKKIMSEQFDNFCTTFIRIMKVLEQNSSTCSFQDYYLYIGSKPNKQYEIKLNCLNASFTFRRISEQKPRSIILCSGTLGSFQIWEKQLGLPFKTKIKVPTFITTNQVQTAIVSHAKSKQKYQFSYQNKNRDDQFEAFTSELKQIQKLIPHGLVVAFSTYQLMQKCMKYCVGFQKPIFFQSKNQNIDKVFTKYSQSAKTQRGALLFIVMKGKFSQGINFNDQLCRCLIVVGIPFLPPYEYRVTKKKSYLENKFGIEAAEEWYYSQTFKAVNQVIGRAIRSKFDYSCILLFDHRFQRKDILKHLPSWFVRCLPQQTNSNQQSSYLGRLRIFFKNQCWLDNQKSKVRKNDDQLQNVLSKTVLAKQESMPLLKLLQQQTPVKINRARQRKLLIQSQKDEYSSLEKQGLLPSQQQKQKKGKNKKSRQKWNQKQSKIEKSPWFSIQYFIQDQMKSYIEASKKKLREKFTNSLQMAEKDEQQQTREKGKGQNSEAGLQVLKMKNKKKMYM